jgi:hypothetical protein
MPVAKSITLRSDDLLDRVDAVLDKGATGDYEVIRFIADNNLTEKWYRPSDKVEIDNEVMKCAMESNFEVRPSESR